MTWNYGSKGINVLPFLRVVSHVTALKCIETKASLSMTQPLIFMRHDGSINKWYPWNMWDNHLVCNTVKPHSSARSEYAVNASTSRSQDILSGPVLENGFTTHTHPSDYVVVSSDSAISTSNTPCSCSCAYLSPSCPNSSPFPVHFLSTSLSKIQRTRQVSLHIILTMFIISTLFQSSACMTHPCNRFTGSMRCALLIITSWWGGRWCTSFISGTGGYEKYLIQGTLICFIVWLSLLLLMNCTRQSIGDWVWVCRGTENIYIKTTQTHGHLLLWRNRLTGQIRRPLLVRVYWGYPYLQDHWMQREVIILIIIIK